MGHYLKISKSDAQEFTSMLHVLEEQFMHDGTILVNHWFRLVKVVKLPTKITKKES